MFAFDLVAFFEQAVENRKDRKRETSDDSAKNCAEKRADEKNHRAARAARNNSPENSDKRKHENHRRPRSFFEIVDDFCNQFARKITDNGRNDVGDGKNGEQPHFFAAKTACVKHNAR